MTAPIVRSPGPPDQDDHCLGVLPRGDEAHRITLHSSSDPAVAHLRRHRVAASPPYDTVAEIHHAGGVVSKVEWDNYHRANTRPEWRARVEAWVKAKIAEGWSS